MCVCVCVCVKKTTVEGDGTPHHCGYGPAPLLNRRLSHTVYFYLGKLDLSMYSDFYLFLCEYDTC